MKRTAIEDDVEHPQLYFILSASMLISSVIFLTVLICITCIVYRKIKMKNMLITGMMANMILCMIANILFDGVNTYIAYWRWKGYRVIVGNISEIIIPNLPELFLNIALILNLCNWHQIYFKIGLMAASHDKIA